ncbi:hypothetical protein D3C85_1624580 [compost metagenome]
MLKKIGVGTPNVRLSFGGMSRTGIFLGIIDGCVAISSKGIVSFIELKSITAVEFGVHARKKKKSIYKCKKIR